MKQSTNTLKSWYVTFAKPVQQQFWDWIDSFRHKDVPITIDDLDQPLKDALQGIAAVNIFRPEEITIDSDTAFQMLAKYNLQHVSFKSNAIDTMTVKVGTTDGGSEYGETDIDAGGTWDLEINETFWANTPIYISGVGGELVVLIFRK
jgi:hypothetical protein